MRIAVDVSQVVYDTGVSTYVKNLFVNILKFDKKNDYVFFGGTLRRRKELENFFEKISNCEKKLFPLFPFLADFLWNRLHLFPIEKLVGNIDIFHSSDWSQPPSKALKVTTIHDLIPIKYPKLSHPKLVSVHRARLNWVKKEVDRIIVPSRTTFLDAVKEGINEKKLVVIPEAPDIIYKPAKKDEVDKIKNKYRISGKYILAVGVNPRKNLERIISSFQKVKASLGIKLVVVGFPFSVPKQVRGVMFLGHVPNGEMPVFYSGAEALVYPSLYEGFGLPILEAFSCRTPVVTSNLGSMAEVAGKAAVLVDPYNTDSISEGIIIALKNKRHYIRLGILKTREYSWERSAQETLKVYLKLKERI